MEEKAVFLDKSRHRILQSYEDRLGLLPVLYEELRERMAGKRAETILALKYLYACMPYSDMGNYSMDTYIDYAEHAVFLWGQYTRVRELPEDIFLNYVLFHRVNEEEITPCRSFFWRQLRDWVKDMDEEAAALEVNYWCAAEVSYQCTDDRTLSAMAVYQRGNGRCGEESTFMVNALRSVGIPSRQVYAPKWSHCDDNHAWVEMWLDGSWHFTGACEPQPVLDKGWFTNAASRAMMVHSRWFDAKKPEGERIGKDGMVTMVNQLERYAPVKNVKVTVVDKSGRPVTGAEIFFEVINYSEYTPIAAGVTDGRGEACLTTGLGSLHLHVRKGTDFVERLMDTRREESCSIVFRPQEAEEYWRACDMSAPEESAANMASISEDMQAAGDERLAQAATARRSKLEHWSNPELERFLRGDAETFKLRRAMNSVLTEKDRTDCICEVLEEHLLYARPYEGQLPEGIFSSYVLNPRVEEEVLGRYRRDICDSPLFKEPEELKREPEKIWGRIDACIRSCPENEHSGLLTTPAACLKLGIGSIKSKEILFVAAARTLGIPARRNPYDGTMEYWREGRFHSVFGGTEKTGRLVLNKNDDDRWNYFQNWSLARLSCGRYTSLKLQELAWNVDELALELKPGRYRILTSNRLPNGNVYANQYELCLKAGEQKEVLLKMRRADLKDMLFDITLPDFVLKDADGVSRAACELLKGKMQVLMFLEAGKEPTEHILQEMLERKEEFVAYGQDIILVVRTFEVPRDSRLVAVVQAFSTIRIFCGDFDRLVYMVGRRMYVDHEKLPLVIVAKGGAKAVYAASGYNVGLGDMLLRLMRLSE